MLPPKRTGPAFPGFVYVEVTDGTPWYVRFRVSRKLDQASTVLAGRAPLSGVTFVTHCRHPFQTARLAGFVLGNRRAPITGTWFRATPEEAAQAVVEAMRREGLTFCPVTVS